MAPLLFNKMWRKSWERIAPAEHKADVNSTNVKM